MIHSHSRPSRAFASRAYKCGRLLDSRYAGVTMEIMTTPTLRQYLSQSLNHSVLIGFRHGWIEGQDDGMIGRALTVPQSSGAIRSQRPRGFSMDAHDAASRRDPSIQQCLHHLALLLIVIETNAITLPVRASPVRL